MTGDGVFVNALAIHTHMGNIAQVPIKRRVQQLSCLGTNSEIEICEDTFPGTAIRIRVVLLLAENQEVAKSSKC